MKLLPIVEGVGDVAAVPVLLRRLVQEVHDRYDVQIARPYRYGDLQKVKGNINRLLLVAAKEGMPILWTLDCDDGCVVDWVTELEKQLPDPLPVPLKFAFFVREYECIFLAEKHCLVQLGISAQVHTNIPPDAESVRGAKGLISRLMPYGRAYKETVHQAQLTAKLDLSIALQESRSVRHINDALLALIN